MKNLNLNVIFNSPWGELGGGGVTNNSQIACASAS